MASVRQVVCNSCAVLLAASLMMRSGPASRRGLLAPPQLRYAYRRMSFRAGRARVTATLGPALGLLLGGCWIVAGTPDFEPDSGDGPSASSGTAGAGNASSATTSGNGGANSSGTDATTGTGGEGGAGSGGAPACEVDGGLLPLGDFETSLGGWFCPVMELARVETDAGCHALRATAEEGGVYPYLTSAIEATTPDRCVHVRFRARETTAGAVYGTTYVRDGNDSWIFPFGMRLPADEFGTIEFVCTPASSSDEVQLLLHSSNGGAQIVDDTVVELDSVEVFQVDESCVACILE